MPLPIHMLNSWRISGRLVGTGLRRGRFPLPTLVRGSSFCPHRGQSGMGGRLAGFSLPAPKPGPGIIPELGKELPAAAGVAKERFPTRLTLRMPKPTPADSQGCIPPTIWATHHSWLLAMAPSLDHCSLLFFSLRGTRECV